jgi:hypothetical protein
MPEQEINFEVRGPLITWPYPLHEILVIQQDFISIIDQSYLELSGKKRVTKQDRLQYTLFASQPRDGSYLQALDLAVKGIEHLAPLAPLLPFVPPSVGPAIAQITGSQIWQNAKSAYELFKKIALWRRDGRTPHVINGTQGDVIIAEGNAQITVNKVTFNTANNSERYYKALANDLEEGKVDEINALDPEKSGISIGRGEKALFSGNTQLGREIEITGKIYDFNTETRVGRLKVGPGQPIPENNYHFHLFGEQSNLLYIVAMTLEAVKVRCIPEYAIKTTGLDLISRLWSLEAVLPKDFRLGPLFGGEGS